jgi:hypothetical protein
VPANHLPAVRLRIPASQSIDVVTFNGDQQRLIENVLDRARRSDPSLEVHFDRNQTNEPILTKTDIVCSDIDEVPPFRL